MAKYAEDAAKLLELVGGKENISAVTHCMTRMRFVLVDESKADVKAIEDLPAAKGTFTQAGQFQVIIGNYDTPQVNAAGESVDLRPYEAVALIERA